MEREKKNETLFNCHLILFQITPGDIETGPQMLHTSAALNKRETTAILALMDKWATTTKTVSLPSVGFYR